MTANFNAAAISLPLDVYLDILGQATPEDGPYAHEDRPAEEVLALNTGFAALAAGFVAFVKAAEPIIGYAETRSMMEDVVHTFPASKDADPFEAIQAALLAAMGLTEEEAKTLLGDLDD